MILLVFALGLVTCKNSNQGSIDSIQLDAEKLYIIEYDFLYARDYSSREMRIFGFSEIDKNFGLRTSLKSYDNDFFYETISSIPDSMKLRINSVIHNYPNDSVFFYTGGDIAVSYFPPPDGHHIFFVLIKKEEKNIIIRFDYRAIPDDLKPIVNNLYKDRRGFIKKDNYNELLNIMDEDFQRKLPLDREIINRFVPMIKP